MAGKKRKSASSDKQQKQQWLPLGADADAAKRRRSGASKKH